MTTKTGKYGQNYISNSQNHQHFCTGHLIVAPFPKLVEIGFHGWYLLANVEDVSGDYFRYFFPSTSERMRICWMVISFGFFKRCGWRTSSLIMTALMFSMLEMQISWLIVA